SSIGANVTTSSTQLYSGAVTLTADTTLTGSTVTFNGTVSNVVTSGLTFLNTLNNTYCTSSGPNCFNTSIIRNNITEIYYFTPSTDGTISSIEFSLNATSGWAVSSAASSVRIDIRQGSTVLSTFSYSSLASNVVTLTGTQTLSSGNQYNLFLYGTSGNVSFDKTLTNSVGTWSFDNGGNAGASGQYGFPAIKTTGSLSGTAYALNIVGKAVFGDGTADRVTGLTTINVSGTTTINTDTISSSSTQSYTGAVTLGTGSTLTTTNSNVSFSSTVNGGNTLTISQGSGTTTFTGVVGGTTPLTSLTVSGSGPVNINGGSITTTGTQSYTGAVSLGADTTLSTTNSNITFGSTLNGDTTGRALTISNGTGDVTFTG
ncbi:MAG: hypothetical protein EBX43_04725, partial [Candidatus Fonsibacter lacus]|nr:hypothetical protein [Candidatus Fonsibacter lacus]